MAERRRYTKHDKATAVIAAEMSNAASAAAATGIPESSIRYWLDSPKFAELRTKTRDDLAAGFHVLAQKAQERLEALIPTMEARDLTILLGVATDKGQLLSGGATGRTETRSLDDTLDDHERQTLRKAIDRELESRVEA
jgi:hypothetical protein